jgi:outer membrane lipopolysaccharide assembly protein LptE/RlpB
MRKNKFLIFCISLLLVLNSCGFQLRKPIDLDYQSYALTGDSSGSTATISILR